MHAWAFIILFTRFTVTLHVSTCYISIKMYDNLLKVMGKNSLWYIQKTSAKYQNVNITKIWDDSFQNINLFHRKFFLCCIYHVDLKSLGYVWLNSINTERHTDMKYAKAHQMFLPYFHLNFPETGSRTVPYSKVGQAQYSSLTWKKKV